MTSLAKKSVMTSGSDSALISEYVALIALPSTAYAFLHRSQRKTVGLRGNPTAPHPSLPKEPRENLATLDVRRRQQCDQARQGPGRRRRRLRPIQQTLSGRGKLSSRTPPPAPAPPTPPRVAVR